MFSDILLTWKQSLSVVITHTPPYNHFMLPSVNYTITTALSHSIAAFNASALPFRFFLLIVTVIFASFLILRLCISVVSTHLMDGSTAKDLFTEIFYVLLFPSFFLGLIGTFRLWHWWMRWVKIWVRWSSLSLFFFWALYVDALLLDLIRPWQHDCPLMLLLVGLYLKRFLEYSLRLVSLLTIWGISFTEI